MNFNSLDNNLVISKKLIKQFLGINDTNTQKLVPNTIINMLVFCIEKCQICF